MTKAEALSRLEALRKAIEDCPAENYRDACLSYIGAEGPRIYLPWDEFVRIFSRAESEYSNGAQFLRAEAAGVTWQTNRTLPESRPQDVDVRELASV